MNSISTHLQHTAPARVPHPPPGAEPKDCVDLRCDTPFPPITLAEMQAQTRGALQRVVDEVSRAITSPPIRVTELLEELQRLSDKLHPDCSIETKLHIRHALWTLRETLDQGPPEWRSDAVRTAVEEARTAALDVTFEQNMRGYPAKAYRIRPSICDIPNFSEVTPAVWRSGQLTADGVKWAVEQGIALEIDLRGDDDDNQWIKPGFSPIPRVHFNIADRTAPTYEQTLQVIDLLNQATADRPVLLHCKAGIGRTGAIIACWRITQGMSAEEAIRYERFSSYDGSLDQESFIRDFANRWHSERHTR